jgi:hypothetical protein
MDNGLKEAVEESQVVEWVVYYIDRDEKSIGYVTKTAFVDYDFTTSRYLDSRLEELGKKYIITGVGKRSSSITKKTDIELDVSAFYDHRVKK